jgi:hypothetical protein
MSTVTIAALLLIAVPLAFNVAFALLAARFDYPDVLRKPTAEILTDFHAGGTKLVLTWWAFGLTALAMVPLVVLTSRAIPDADPDLLALATTVGVLAALVQTLGLMRWPFLVPYLAGAHAGVSDAGKEAIDVVFQAFHRYLGVAVGEHLGYALTGAWTVLTGIALTQTSAAPAAIGVIGIVIGPVLMACSLEFVGTGFKAADKLTPPTYVAWSLWLVATGVALLVS